MIVLGLVAAVGIVACGGEGGAETPDAEDISIAWVVGNVNDAFYQKATEGALDQAEELGITLINQGPNAFDPSEQIPVVDSLLTQQPDAIAIAPVDAQALRAPLARWTEAGIPIVIFDTAIADDAGIEIVTRIGSDNYGGGVMAGEHMVSLIGDSGKVGIIDLNTSDQTLIARADGFADALAEYPDIEVLDVQYTELDFPRAQTIAQTFVNQHSDLSGIFATYSFATEYAAKGLQDLEVDGDVILIGFEAGDAQIQAIREGALQATVAQQPYEQGRRAVQAAYDAVVNPDVEQEDTSLDNVLITAENIDEMTEYFYAVD